MHSSDWSWLILILANLCTNCKALLGTSMRYYIPLKSITKPSIFTNTSDTRNDWRDSAPHSELPVYIQYMLSLFYMQIASWLCMFIRNSLWLLPCITVHVTTMQKLLIKCFVWSEMHSLCTDVSILYHLTPSMWEFMFVSMATAINVGTNAF